MRKKIRHLDESPVDYESTSLKPILSTSALPNGWSVSPVRQIARIVRGVSYGKSDAKETNSEGHTPILRATNIQDNGLVLDRDLVYVPNKYISEEQKLKIGDIVIATSSGSKHLVGKAAQVKTDWSGSFGAFCAVLRPSTNVEPRYLGYFFNSPIYKSYISAKAMGVNINNLRRGDIEELHVPLASISEQKRIVAVIEKQFSRLDEAVANLMRIKANLKRYKAAVLNAACMGEIGGVNRQGWTETTLGAVASKIRNGYSLKPDAEQGTRIFRISAVRPLTLALDDIRCLSGKISDYADFQVMPGDILFTRYNGNPDFVGVCAVVPDRCPPTIHPDKLIRVKVPETILIPQMLAILASAGESRAFLKQRIRTTAGQAGISGADLKSLPLSVPPIAEQNRIVSEVDRLLSTTTEIDTQVTVNLIRAERLRQAILKKAFSETLGL